MQCTNKMDAAQRSWLAFLAATLAVCLSFGALGIFAEAALAAPETSSSSAAATESSAAASQKASDEDNAAVEAAAEEAAQGSLTAEDAAVLPLGDDLLIGAETYDSSADDVKANLFAGARTIDLKQATIGADAFIGGETINITDLKAANNIFVAGNNITISGTTGKGLFVCGNNLDISADADTVQAAGRTIFLKGTFEGDVNVSAASVVIDPYIVVNGTLNVEAETEPTIASTAKISNYNFNQAEFNDGTNIATGFANIGSAAWVEDLVKTLISILVIGIFMLIFCRTEVVDGMGRLVRNRPVAILVTGLLSIILVPFIVLGLFFIQVGWPIATVFMMLAVCMTVLCVAYTAIALGRAAFPRINKWISSIIFLAIFALLMSLPVVDFIVAALCLVFAVGSLVQGWWVWRRGTSLAGPDDPGEEFTVPRGSHYADESAYGMPASVAPATPAATARPLVPSNIANNTADPDPFSPDEPKA